MKNHANKISVLAPLTGQIITLEQVPDPVFSGKMLGDGIAIVPEEGKIYSPVNGIVTTVSTTLHAYGFSTTEGLDILVHVGLETVSLNGDGFKSYVKEGDAVAIEIAEQFGDYLGKGLAAVAAVVNPEIFVIGGGVSKAGQVLLDGIGRYFPHYMFHACKETRFALAKLGNDAGMYGCFRLVLDHLTASYV